MPCFCAYVKGGGEARRGKLDQLGEGAGPDDLLLLGAFPGELQLYYTLYAWMVTTVTKLLVSPRTPSKDSTLPFNR